MSDEQKDLLPILGYGERMIEPVHPSSGGGSVTYPRTYEEARIRVKQQVSTLTHAVMQIPAHKRMDDVVVTVRLHHKFLAKSYTPNAFFREVNVDNIGSRRWCYKDEEDAAVRYSKLHFVKTSMNSLSQLETILEHSECTLSESFRNDVRKRLLSKLSIVRISR